MDKASSSSLAAVDLNNPSLKFGLTTFKDLVSTMKDLPPSAIMSLQPSCKVHLSNVVELGYPVGDLEHQIDCLMSRCRSYMDLDSMSPQEVAEAVLVPDIQSGIEQISSNKIGRRRTIKLYQMHGNILHLFKRKEPTTNISLNNLKRMMLIQEVQTYGCRSREKLLLLRARNSVH